MNKRYGRGKMGSVKPRSAALILLSACFVLGVLLGCLLASIFQKGSAEPLFSYLNGYFSVLEAGELSESSLLSTFWEIGRWPLFAGLMATTLFGVVALPALLLLRGFLLSYAVSVLVCLYGGADGFLFSAVIFGVPAFSSTLSLFIIGQLVLPDGTQAMNGRKRWDHRQLAVCSFAIFICLFLGTVIQHWICPALLNWIAAVR